MWKVKMHQVAFLSNEVAFKWSTQWIIISITSMEVNFWGVKSRGCENSHATEVKYAQTFLRKN
jgi:hypothetical protein